MGVLNTALFARAKVITATTDSRRLKIGIKLLNTAYNSHRITRGPSGSSEHVGLAKTFKNFWGKKVELRRFGDGSVVHACVWQGSKLKCRKSGLRVRAFFRSLTNYMKVLLLREFFR